LTTNTTDATQTVYTFTIMGLGFWEDGLAYTVKYIRAEQARTREPNGTKPLVYSIG